MNKLLICMIFILTLVFVFAEGCIQSSSKKVLFYNNIKIGQKMDFYEPSDRKVIFSDEKYTTYVIRLSFIKEGFEYHYFVVHTNTDVVYKEVTSYKELTGIQN